MKKTRDVAEPSRASLADVPEVEFANYGAPRRNPFAKRIKKYGWELVHDEPSAASLREIPELDPIVKGKPNPYAKRIKASGYSLQVGRKRPKRGSESGPSVVKSVRLPPVLWERLEERARAEGIALHALVRSAIVGLLEEKPKRKKPA